MHALTHTHTHARMHARTHMHTHAHTHTHTHLLQVQAPLVNQAWRPQLPHLVVDAQHATRGKRNNRQPSGKGCLLKLGHKLGQLGVCAAAENDLHTRPRAAKQCGGPAKNWHTGKGCDQSCARRRMHCVWPRHKGACELCPQAHASCVWPGHKAACKAVPAGACSVCGPSEAV